MKIKFIILFFIACAINFTFAQQKDAISKKWNSEQKNINYGKDSKYKGPKEWNSSSPVSLGTQTDEQPEYYEDNQTLDGIISQNRKLSRGKGKTKNGEIKPPKEIEIPEFDPPDIDEPDIDVDAPDPTKISKSTWQILLFILIFAGVMTLLYFWIKKQNGTGKFTQEFDDEWNPEVITKSELELRLDAAILREDFREAIRVYFTMILQELIALDLIKWKREKTNHQYIQELKDIQIKSSQSKCTRLFEIVWYGEYEIDRTKFEELKPHFISFITTLKSKKID